MVMQTFNENYAEVTKDRASEDGDAIDEDGNANFQSN